MKKVIGCILIVSLLLTACEPPTENEKTKEPGQGFLVEADQKIGSILTKETDISKQGMEVPVYHKFSSQMVKGDDGACYYFRQVGEKKDHRFIFYKNGGEKVCETVLPEGFEYFFIASFVKYGEYFWVDLCSDGGGSEILVTLRMEDGEWGNLPTTVPKRPWEWKEPPVSVTDEERVVIYGENVYCTWTNNWHAFYDYKIDSDLRIIDMDGTERDITLEENYDVMLQTIIDDKLYYSRFPLLGDTAELMRCDLDGQNKEQLFEYPTVKGIWGGRDPGTVRIDGEFLYLFEPYCGYTLTRIPLYGGKIEKIAEADWYDLSEDNIFYMDRSQTIYKVDKNLKNPPEAVTKGYETSQWGDVPFLYADNHLMIEGCNQEGREIIDAVWRWEEDPDETNPIRMSYASEYYWVSETGEVEHTLEGHGISERYYKLYDRIK